MAQGPDARHSLCGDSFAATGKAEAFRRRCLDADLADLNTEDLGNALTHGGSMRPHLRLLRDNRTIHMIYDGSALANQLGGMG